MNNSDIVEAKAKCRFLSEVVGAKRRGDTVRTTAAYARHLIEIGVLDESSIKIISAAAGPSEQKPAGPSEQKPAKPDQAKGGAAPKKSSGASTAGRSIGTASLSAPGKVLLSSSLEGVLASLPGMAWLGPAPSAIAMVARWPLLP